MSAARRLSEAVEPRPVPFEQAYRNALFRFGRAAKTNFSTAGRTPLRRAFCTFLHKVFPGLSSLPETETAEEKLIEEDGQTEDLQPDESEQDEAIQQEEEPSDEKE